MAGGIGSALAKGGMLTKVLAAQRAARSGAHTVIASGREPDVLVRLAQRRAHRHAAHRADRAARRAQAVARRPPHGQPASCTLDAGAVKALARDGKSLLPIGVVEVTGRVRARRGRRPASTPTGREIARGLVELLRRGDAPHHAPPSGEIESILGYVDEPELIHRDNLVLL